MIAGRLAHNEDMYEVTYTAVKAIMAAVNGRVDEEDSSDNKKRLVLDGYNAWVSLKWEDKEKAWVVTGYRDNDKHSSADDKRRAMNLAERYALETFGGLQQVGAALDYAIARLAREYKLNNADAVAAGTFMKAPNGKATNLTERQWLQVRTAAFKRWFGEWERAAELTFDGKEHDN